MPRKSQQEVRPTEAAVLMDNASVGVPLRIGEIAVGTSEQIAALVMSGAADAAPAAIEHAKREGGKRVNLHQTD